MFFLPKQCPWALAALLWAAFWVVPAVAQDQEGGFAKGVVIIRSRPGESDEFANAVLFKRLEGYAVVTKIFISGNNPLVIENINIAATLTFDDLFTRDLLDETDKILLQQKEVGLKALIKRFPKSAAALKPALETVQLYQSNLASEQVRSRGGWTSRAAYLSMLKMEESRIKADRDRIKNEQLAREQTATAMREAETNAKRAVEKRLREEEAARKAEERQAAVIAMQKAAEEERSKKEEAEDAARREGNLKLHPASFSAQHLLAGFNNFALTVEKAHTADTHPPEMKAPESWAIAGATPLPRLLGSDTGLRAGGGATSPSVLVVQHAGNVLAASFCVPLKLEDERLTNDSDLRELHQMTSTLDPIVAQWFPFGLASVRVKQGLRHGIEDGETTITRDLDGRFCELTLSEARLHDDGGFYAYLTLTLH